jgi:chemotaxis protein MotA
MKGASAIGIVGAIVLILTAGIMEGVDPSALINLPSMMIVFGGTCGAVFAGVGMKQFLLIPKMYAMAILEEPRRAAERIPTLVGFAERARKDGLLALEEEIEQIEDPFLRKGMQLVVDGTDPDLVREILENEIDAMAQRHKDAWMVFQRAGALAPTIGVLGTVVSLVHVLGNLSAPETLGPMVAGAFMATLYGVGSANVVYFPIAYKLQFLSEKEVEERQLIVEGIMAIQAGDNPRIVQEKLISMVPPAERGGLDRNAGRGAGADDVAQTAKAA